MATSLLLAFAAGGASTNASATPDSFQGLMEAAMRRMHIAMTAPDTGNPDHDFAAMMIPHHQGAIDMAEIQLRFGKDERLRRLAQGIIVEQRQEIVVMQQVLETLPVRFRKPYNARHSYTSWRLMIGHICLLSYA